MSSQWENEKAKEIARQTGDAVRVYTCGYSGNNAFAQPDIHLTDARTGLCHDAELKGPIESDTLAIEASDIEQLVECQNNNTNVYLVVKFQYREPLVVRYFNELTGAKAAVDGAADYNEMSPVEKLRTLIPPAFNARVSTSDETGVTRLYLDKPSTDDWPSATAGADDVDAILSGMGIKTNKSVSIVD